MSNIVQAPIVEEIEQSFLNYSLSVITDRAIPAVEDGMKPVMRRILWCMLEDGFKSDKQYVKCARPVGDTMGRYHPHGDSSIYGALIGASQPWNMRYPLIDFHGNNGSRDGDPPAAMRYTECRLSKISEETLSGIKKETVDWIPNFDETTDEPVYLPGMFPNLLCNGTTGIAVAMACSFAPHNLTEVMSAAIAFLKGTATNSKDLCQYITGPDFPTGGLVINQKELQNAYLTGKGRARIRGEYKVEKAKNGADILVFTSIPYKISKEDLISEIDSLCEEKKLDGIIEIRDESNKQGVRFVIELAKGTNADVIAARLYELTDLETTYSYNQVALVDKTPKLLTLADIIENYVNHQKDVYRRANEYDLKKLEVRIHKADARAALIKQYKLDTIQADAILGMTLSRLANMEKLAIQNEKEEKEKERAIILARLNSEAIFKQDLINVLTQFKDHYGDSRRTTITNIEVTKVEKEIAQIVPEDVVVVVTDAGNIKRVPKKNFKVQKRNGKGVKTQDDITLASVDTNTVDIILVFTNKGKVYRLGVDAIPEGTQATRGTAISTLVEMEPTEQVAAIASTGRDTGTNKFVWFVTKRGLIKKTNISEYNGAKRKQGVQAIGLREGDSLVSVWVGENSDILIFSKEGMCIRFDGSSVGATGRVAAGVQGIKLADNDEAAVATSIGYERNGIGKAAVGQVFVGCSDGSGKRVMVTEFTRQNRAGRGLKFAHAGQIVAAIGDIEDSDNLFISGDVGAICIKVGDIAQGSRTSAGIKVIKGSKLVSAVRV